jgi:transposase
MFMETAAGAVVRSKRTRKYRSPEERCRIVEETFASGVSVATVAREYGLNANLLFHWRKLYQAGVLRPTEDVVEAQRMLRVTVSEEDRREAPGTVPASVREAAGCERSEPVSLGSIELTVAKVKVRIAGAVDAVALRVVLECLLG